MTQMEQQVEAMRNAIIRGGEWRPLLDKMLLSAALQAPPSQIMAQHPRSEQVGGLTGKPFCNGYHESATYWPCETYALADALAAELNRKQRLEAVLEGWDQEASSNEAWLADWQVSPDEASGVPAVTALIRAHINGIRVVLDGETGEGQ